MRVFPVAKLDIPSTFSTTEDFWDFKTYKAKKSEDYPSRTRILDSLNSIIAKSKNIRNFSLNISNYGQKSKLNVLIKNIGNMKAGHLKNALSYALSHSETKVAINENFQEVRMEEILKDWQYDFSGKLETNEALHLVFSLKEQHSEQMSHFLLLSSFQTIKNNLSQYKFALIPHTHQNYPHIHIILNKTNQMDGKKLHFKSKKECRDFFAQLREDFKNNLQKHSMFLSHDYTNTPSVRGIEALIYEMNNEKNAKNRSNEYLELIEDFSKSIGLKYVQAKNQQIKEKLKQDFEKVLWVKEQLKQFSHNFSSLQIKEFIFETLNTIDKKYLSKNQVYALQKISDQIVMGKKNLTSFNLPKELVGINQKTNAMTLKKAFYQLRKIHFMLPQSLLEEDKKVSISKTIQNKQEEILQILQKRFDFVLQSLENNRKKHKELTIKLSKTEITQVDDFEKLLKQLQRIEKNIKFNIQEILSASKLLQRSGTRQKIETDLDQIAQGLRNNQKLKKIQKEEHKSMKNRQM